MTSLVLASILALAGCSQSGNEQSGSEQSGNGQSKNEQSKNEQSGDLKDSVAQSKLGKETAQGDSPKSTTTGTSESESDAKSTAASSDALKPDAIDPEAALAKLTADFNAAVEELSKQIDAAATDEEKQKIYDQLNPEPKYVQQLFALAQKHPKSDAAFNATMQIILNRNESPEFPAAMDFAIENFGARVQWQKICAGYLEELPSQQLEDWMRGMIENATSPEVKAQTMHLLYEYFDQFPTFATTISYNPAIEQRLPKDQVDYIYNRKLQVHDDLVKMMKTLQTDYAEVKSKHGRPFKTETVTPLYELQNLNVGQVAPDISGKDFDGIEFKLSDYRGKVVMLDFWGQWCPPCRAMYPHERDLVKQLAGKPFVLIGVNSDRRLEYAKKATVEENLVWRNFWNGPTGRVGNIAQQWNVSAWPTVYLIDEEGVIQYKEVFGSDIDRGIEKMLANLGHSVEIKSVVARSQRRQPQVAFDVDLLRTPFSRLQP